MTAFRCTLALVFLIVSTSPSWADVTAEQRAFSLYQEARSDYAESNLKDAVRKLEEAWKLFQHPVIALQLTEILEKMGKPEKALAILEMVNPTEPGLRSKVDLRRKSLRSFLAMPLKVSIFSNVANTTIVIDGNQRSIAPVELELQRGTHRITAIATGYRRTERTIDVRGSSAILEKFEMQALTGTLAVKTLASDLSEINIRIDRQEWNLRPHESSVQATDPRSLQVGQHQMTCWHTGQTKDVQRFTVREGEDVILMCRSGFASEASTRKIWGWVTAGGGIASAISGGALFWSYRQDVEKAELDPELFIKSTNKHIFAGLFGLTAIGLGITSYFLFKSASKRGQKSLHTHSERRWQITPILGRHFRGIGATGRF